MKADARSWALFLAPQALVMMALVGVANCTAAERATVQTDVATALQDLGVKGAEMPEPGLAQAVATVWAGYGRTDPAPKVLLVVDAGLTCTDPNSGNPGFPVVTLSGPTCREGFTLLPWEVSVAYRGQPWAQTSLAHEMAHVMLIRSLQGNPPGDPNHLTAPFQPGGAVDQANAKLAALGI